MSDMNRYEADVQLLRSAPGAIQGSLQFWGDWFGRPHDNIHTLTRCETFDEGLVLAFDMSERLQIWSPEALSVSVTSLTIHSARRVRWEWNNYGHSPGPRHWRDYRREMDRIILESSEPRDQLADPNSPAVKLWGVPLPAEMAGRSSAPTS